MGFPFRKAMVPSEAECMVTRSRSAKLRVLDRLGSDARGFRQGWKLADAGRRCSGDGPSTAVGARMVWQAEKVTIARNKVYREIASRRQLVRERDELMRRVAEMKAATRLEIRARMLTCRYPRMTG